MAIVTDSTHYLPAGVAQENGLHQVPLYVRWKGREDRETELGDLRPFYDHLREATEVPTTSQPAPGDFLELYERLLDEGREIVSVHISSGISGTDGAARRAKAELEGRGGERITVVDSQTAAVGLALVVLAAAASAREGRPPNEVALAAHRARRGLKMWFALDTLEYLRRGGRIGTAGAWLGSALQMKPILTVDGEIKAVERVRTSGRAFERMVEHLEARREEGARAWGVHHIQAEAEAEALVERGREILGFEPACVCELGPVIGAHVGPGLIGVGATTAAIPLAG